MDLIERAGRLRAAYRSTRSAPVAEQRPRPAPRNPKDLDRACQAVATEDTARFINEHLPHVQGRRGTDAHQVKLEMLADAVSLAPAAGLVLEFGVATGETLGVIAGVRPAHGFDSFEGLPESWYGAYQEGTFAQPIPEVANAELHVGWFEDSLPGFLEQHHGPFAFVHMDADLYSSTKTIFDLAGDRFVPGTVIQFDEYWNYPGWQGHEHKAFTEFVEAKQLSFDYVTYNAMHEQLVVRLT